MRKNVPVVKRETKQVICNDGMQVTRSLLPVYGVYAPTKNNKMRFQIFIGAEPEKDADGTWQPTKQCKFTFMTSSYADCNEACMHPDEVRRLDIIDWKKYEDSIEELSIQHSKRVGEMNKAIKALKSEIESLKNKRLHKTIYDKMALAFEKMKENFGTIH